MDKQAQTEFRVHPDTKFNMEEITAKEAKELGLLPDYVMLDNSVTGNAAFVKRYVHKG